MEENKKTKILAAGDLHGDLSLVYKLAEKAERENVDLVILAGDLTMAEASTDNIIGPFLKKGKKVLFIPGNHESFATADFLGEVYKPNAKNIHDYSFKFNNIGIFGVGGTTNIGPAVPITEEEMFNLLKRGSERVKDLAKKIMVTHIHPSDTKMEKMSRIVSPSRAVRKAIEQLQPDFALCSHVHEADGLEEQIGKTRLINVGRRGKIIEV
ncbi:hypothetical protein CO154_02800 [Candidatus Pacearchaeota archaeon CG_4_9_14_3_um_filter_31_7]|nr:MAG: hypothetical protein AUJ10_01725 [Candidatus Pacearchaeota archaeon CG1_02_31_27]PIZ81211.1 MAG: hypothetical protein COX99_00510 [Candidatus Pacearchaeota archaeon CG_4_10_14_0_2_um_filter_31_10]PJA70450.1 MAG: hypothetical protein CO154_02800 [Candidatus Pacearchaeota archaeon CG_4_9_14_3_um_filter_31_7]